MAAKQHMDVRIFITANSTANSCHHADSWSPSYLHHLLGSEALSTGDAATLQSITDWKLQFYKILSTTRDERSCKGTWVFLLQMLCLELANKGQETEKRLSFQRIKESHSQRIWMRRCIFSDLKHCWSQLHREQAIHNQMKSASMIS